MFFWTCKMQFWHQRPKLCTKRPKTFTQTPKRLKKEKKSTKSFFLNILLWTRRMQFWQPCRDLSWNYSEIFWRKVWKHKKTKFFGTQTFPQSVTLDTWNAFSNIYFLTKLSLKRKENCFDNPAEKILLTVQTLFAQSPNVIIKYSFHAKIPQNVPLNNIDGKVFPENQNRL